MPVVVADGDRDGDGVDDDEVDEDDEGAEVEVVVEEDDVEVDPTAVVGGCTTLTAKTLPPCLLYVTWRMLPSELRTVVTNWPALLLEPEIIWRAFKLPITFSETTWPAEFTVWFIIFPAESTTVWRVWPKRELTVEEIMPAIPPTTLLTSLTKPVIIAGFSLIVSSVFSLFLMMEKKKKKWINYIIINIHYYYCNLVLIYWVYFDVINLV